MCVCVSFSLSLLIYLFLQTTTHTPFVHLAVQALARAQQTAGGLQRAASASVEAAADLKVERIKASTLQAHVAKLEAEKERMAAKVAQQSKALESVTSVADARADELSTLRDSFKRTEAILQQRLTDAEHRVAASVADLQQEREYQRRAGQESAATSATVLQSAERRVSELQAALAAANAKVAASQAEVSQWLTRCVGVEPRPLDTYCYVAVLDRPKPWSRNT